MEHLYEKAQQSAEFIRSHMTKRPKIAVVLGSGLGNLTADFTETEELPYRDTTGFRYEVLTDEPAVRKAADDILFDFVGEENPHELVDYRKMGGL